MLYQKKKYQEISLFPLIGDQVDDYLIAIKTLYKQKILNTHLHEIFDLLV